MATIRIETSIAAPVEVCFDLSRDIDLHIESLAETGERAVAGVTSGLIGMGEQVTWRARHLGMTREFTSQITQFDPPRHFRDEMLRGAFKSFVHDHYFHQREGATLMEDVVVFRSPLGPLGAAVDWLFMTGYLRRLLSARCQAIKTRAERLALGEPPPA